MELSVPKEPRRLGFQPEKTFLADVFANDIARPVWLMICAQHLVNEEAPRWVWYLTRLIKEMQPMSPQALFGLIERTNRIFSMEPHLQFVTGDYGEVHLFVERLLDAVNGKNPVAYTIEIQERAASHH